MMNEDNKINLNIGVSELLELNEGDEHGNQETSAPQVVSSIPEFLSLLSTPVSTSQQTLQAPAISAIIGESTKSSTESAAGTALRTLERLLNQPAQLITEEEDEQIGMGVAEPQQQPLSVPSSSQSSASAMLDEDEDSDEYTQEEYAQIYAIDDGLSDEDDDELRKLFGKYARKKKKKKKKKVHRGKKSKIPEHISTMMGQANMSYICGEHQKAVDVLLEVIRLMPNLSDPYHTLGLIYETMNQKKRAIEFFMIAALLTPHAIDLWKRNAQMCIELELYQQAIYCLTRIIKSQPDNNNAIFDRSLYYLKLGNKKKAIEGFRLLFDKFPLDIEVVTQLASLYYEVNQPDQAIFVLKDTLDKYPDRTDLTVVNMLAELYMGRADYATTIDMIDTASINRHNPLELMPIDIRVKYAICLAYTGNLLQAEQRVFNSILSDLNPAEYRDIFFDIAETYFVLHEYRQAIPIYKTLLQHQQSDHILWVKVGQAYKHLQDYERAADHYKVAITLQPDDVHTRLYLSDVYKELEQIEKALEVLETSFIPHGISTVAFSKTVQQLLENAGRNEMQLEDDDVAVEAGGFSSDEESDVEAANQDKKDPDYTPEENQMHDDDEITATGVELEPESACLETSRPNRRRIRESRKDLIDDVKLIARRGWFLFSSHKYEEFVKVCFPFIKAILELDSMVYVIRPSYKRQHIRSVVNYLPKEKNKKKRWLEIEKQVNRKRTAEDTWTWNEALQALGGQELYYFLLTACKVFAYTGRYEQFCTIMDTLLKSHRATGISFHMTPEERKEKIHQLRYLYIGIAYNFGDYDRANRHITIIIRERPNSVALWNLFSMINSKTRNFSASNKFAVRMLSRFPTSIPLMVLVAHNCSISGNYRLALGEYFKAYQYMPNEPLVCLCIGINYLNLVMNRGSANRHLLVMQAFAFLFKYYKLRNGDQEANFNIARAFHQIGVNYLAVTYYEKVLQLGTAKSGKQYVKQQPRRDKDSLEYMPPEENQNDLFGGFEDDQLDEEDDVEMSLIEKEEFEKHVRSQDLSREAAYNLCLLYAKSHNNAMIGTLMRTYLTV